MGVTVDSAPASARLQRVRVFIDFWNFQLSAKDATGGKYSPDWMRLPRWLATDAAASITGVPASGLQYEGASVYLSVAPGAADARLRDWATKFLDRVSGVTVVLKERVKKLPPTCQSCHERAGSCCHCGAILSLTEE